MTCTAVSAIVRSICNAASDIVSILSMIPLTNSVITEALISAIVGIYSDIFATAFPRTSPKASASPSNPPSLKADVS